MLTVLTNRLARIIDRSRVLEDRLEVAHDERYMSELDMLYRPLAPDQFRRSHSATGCGLLICLVIAMLFLGDTTNLPLDKYVAGLFVCWHVRPDRRLRFPAARNFYRLRTLRCARIARPRAHR